MEKLNIAELLKDCPKGMELDCALFENLEFDHIGKNVGAYSIICRVKTEWGGYNVHTFTEYGCYSTEKYSKCVIFPKGKTTWEGFQRPFKDGDIISNDKYVAIFYKIGTPRGCKSPNVVYYHCCYSKKYHEFRGKLDFGIGYSTEFKYATEEEKEKLFKVIKDNGYKWNPETNSLEKLIEPKFKVGDVIQDKDGYKIRIIEVNVEDKYYKYQSMITKVIGSIIFNKQNSYELVPNKFDITTLKPFDKVLVSHNKGEWHIQFFEKYSPTSKFPFICIGGSAYQKCVPYEENKHLMDTTNDCDEYYKIWE